MHATAQAESRLRQGMKAGGLDENAISPPQALRRFRDFSRDAFACAEDAPLGESGLYALEDERFFCGSLTRRFTLEEDGDSDRMEEVRLVLRHVPETGFAVPSQTLWSFDGDDDFDAFFAAVEKEPSFLLLSTDHGPVQGEITFEELRVALKPFS